jgi:hypothetical protein
MKTQFTDVGTFLAEVQRLDSLKRDFVVPQGKMAMGADDSTLLFGDGAFKMLPIAHEQIRTRLGIPAAYYDRMPEIPGLRANNVNAWLNREPTTKRLVRTRDGQARALLSDRYRVLDDLLILGAAMPVLAANPDALVCAAILSDEALYLQIAFPKITGELKVGDVVQSGLTIKTSEVGRGKVDVLRWIRQLKCKNGYIGESVFSKRHVGRRIGEDEEDYTIFGDDTIEAELKSFQLRLRDTIAAAFTQESFDAELAKFRGAAGDAFNFTQTEGVIKEVTKRYNFTDETMKAVLDRVVRDMDFTRMGVAAAITFEAHETDNPERAFDMEAAGYDLVNLPNAEWKRIAA